MQPGAITVLEDHCKLFRLTRKYGPFVLVVKPIRQKHPYDNETNIGIQWAKRATAAHTRKRAIDSGSVHRDASRVNVWFDVLLSGVSTEDP